ncbi:hypothetical protein CRG98_015697 [Punica granatum]|uniref:Uncharacterized protein n=1 Tax=Punica granatum TaxID=22663 RepID=A0A2I0K878_PUNGR|nr:hypothetical protein CRG98_015697 [Punica granatum]
MGACPASCEVHERLLGGFAICTGALPCGLLGARALARQCYLEDSSRIEAVVGMRQTCIRQRKTPFGVYIVIPAYGTMGANNSCQSYHIVVTKMCEGV